MSRSNPTTKNPAGKFLSWSGSKGELVYYDKEKEERVAEQLPFMFMVLDELNTITGFCEQDSSSYWSNEVRSIKNDELTVKTSAGTKQVGKYSELTEVRSKGAKYAKSVYIAYKENGSLVIGNFKVYGAALTAWIEFCRKADVYKSAVTLTGSEEATKGTTKYFIPKFETIKISDETNAEAVELDKQLQTYLNQYFAYVPEEHEEAQTVAPAKDDVVYDVSDEPINLDDIPF